MLSLLRHVEACNRCDLAAFRPFAIDDRVRGLASAEAAKHLLAEKLVTEAGEGVFIPDGGFDATSAQLARILAALGEAGLAAASRGELMPVVGAWGQKPVAAIDRVGLPALGLPAFGVHVNGFVRRDGELFLWVAHRAMDRLVAPGKLDHLVAGGLPLDHSAIQTMIKEAEEEAGLSAEIAGRARPAGVVTYRLALPEGLRNDTLFVYDLELPPDVTPVNRDGEVERFELWPVAGVIEELHATNNFKFNVPLVLIDFLIRHGLLDPDEEPDYVALAQGLRR
jgi:8-oxo-dGTP pyrophosphatase MutT (NUDIX family)